MKLGNFYDKKLKKQTNELQVKMLLNLNQCVVKSFPFVLEICVNVL